MVLPPKHLYSVEIRNDTDAPIHVAVKYSTVDHETVEKKENVAPGSSAHFDQKTHQPSGDTATYTYEVKEIHVTSNNNTKPFTAPFVSSVTQHKKYSVKGSSNGVELEAL